MTVLSDIKCLSLNLLFSFVQSYLVSQQFKTRDYFLLSQICLNSLQEEHFISKLLFSWPQVSCVSGFPAKGSRVVFVSYKDCAGQVCCSLFLRFVLISVLKYDIAFVDNRQRAILF